MTLDSHATPKRSPDPPDMISLLAAALGDRTVPAICRTIASDDSHNPGEGLALLEAYVSIRDARTRQAVLDAVVAIAGTNPHRRVR